MKSGKRGTKSYKYLNNRLGFGITMRDMRLSKSAILTYKNCPYRFYLDYVVNLRKFRDEPLEGSPLKIGTECHDIFENFYKMSEIEELREPYSDNIYSLLMTFPNAHKYEDHMENFATFNSDMIEAKGLENFAPVAVEQEIYNKELNLIGYIDRVDIGKEGKMVLDYKTSKKPRAYKDFVEPGEDWLYNYNVSNRVRTTFDESDYMIELSIYKLLYELEFGEEITHTGIYFSKTNIRPIARMTNGDAQEALDIIESVRDLIELKMFERNKTFLCRFCDHARICLDGIYDGDWY
jgi:CRISPR/Cas system-associated exonuclease Cas4 (RecB family)